LLIDDDPDVLGTFGTALRLEGYRVFEAEDGDEGIKLAREHVPDLIVTDINMPGTDGRTVLQVLREDPALGSTQIVLMTGNTETFDTRSCMDLGADDFLPKPFNFEQLARCVSARLRRAHVHWRVENKLIADLRESLRSTLPHEFFTPLAGILGLVQVLRGDLRQLREDELNDILDGIERSGWRLHRTLKNYLAILDLDNAKPGESPRTTIILPATVRDVIATQVEAVAKRHGRAGDVLVDVSPCLLPGDVRLLSTVVEELVDNACEFSRKGTPVRVALSADGVFTVTDKGRGMSADEIARIGSFHQFDRDKFEQQGLGLGLVLVQKLASKVGASFALESVVREGTKVTVRFPLEGAGR
jgi:signal transduction histidine kinase